MKVKRVITERKGDFDGLKPELKKQPEDGLYVL